MKPIVPTAVPCLLACAGPAVADGDIASLAGVDRERLLEKLADFRSGKKPATIMRQIAKGFTDAQLDWIATHFSEQE